MTLDEEFNKAAEEVRKMASEIEDDDLLQLYAYYKQALEGDCNTSRPGMLEFRAKAKWDAWNRHKGTLSKSEAKSLYVEKVQTLMESHGL